MLLINKTISLRVTQKEYDYLKSKVDFFTFDSQSSYIRSLIRKDMLRDEEDLNNIVHLER